MWGRRRFTRLLGVLLVVVGVAIVLYEFGFLSGGGGEVVSSFYVRPRALYYDPLWREYPNETLVDLVVSNLEAAGYVVDVYKGSEAGLFELESMDAYKVVIIRGHGAYNNDSSIGKPSGPYLFTGLLMEEAEEKYGGRVDYMLLKGQAAPGVVPPGGPLVPLSEEELEILPRYLAVSVEFFKVTPLFFNDTVILYGPCYGLGDIEKDYSLAETLLSKGAKAFAGFQGLVTWPHADAAIALFTERLAETGDPVKALLEVQETLPPDPYTGAKLEVVVRS